MINHHLLLDEAAWSFLLLFDQPLGFELLLRIMKNLDPEEHVVLIVITGVFLSEDDLLNSLGALDSCELIQV